MQPAAAIAEPVRPAATAVTPLSLPSAPSPAALDAGRELILEYLQSGRCQLLSAAGTETLSVAAAELDALLIDAVRAESIILELRRLDAVERRFSSFHALSGAVRAQLALSAQIAQDPRLMQDAQTTSRSHSRSENAPRQRGSDGTESARSSNGGRGGAAAAAARDGETAAETEEEDETVEDLGEGRKKRKRAIAIRRVLGGDVSKGEVLELQRPATPRGDAAAEVAAAGAAAEEKPFQKTTPRSSRRLLSKPTQSPAHSS
jgi:hypothetical protein